MSDNTGMCTFCSLAESGRGRPVKFSPISPDRPNPNSVNASPVATWLVTRVCVKYANTSATAIPMTIAAATPATTVPKV